MGGRFGTAQRAEDLLAAMVFAGFSTQNVKFFNHQLPNKWLKDFLSRASSGGWDTI